MHHNTVQIELTESNARYVLLALRELTQRLQALSNDETVDEDERFLHANDLMEASRAYDKVEAAAVGVFGPRVTEHGHELL
jgi:hypothetical protein